MAEIDPVFEIETQAVAQLIDELDYFQLLKLEHNAAPDAIKAAYFRESRTYHPDRYYSHPDEELKAAIGRIYKRINEAWVCLRDDAKRGKYLTDINGPDRDKKLRYTEASEEELKREREAELGTTPQGRRIFQQAMLDLDAGRLQQAAQNFKMALMYEPQNELFKRKSEEAHRRLAGGR